MIVYSKSDRPVNIRARISRDCPELLEAYNTYGWARNCPVGMLIRLSEAHWLITSHDTSFVGIGTLAEITAWWAELRPMPSELLRNVWLPKDKPATPPADLDDLLADL